MSRGARAIVICPDIRNISYDLDANGRLDEARGLALAIGIVVADTAIVPVRNVKPNTLFGSGQVANIATQCEQNDADLVIIDGALSPIQQRNLEDKLQRKVIDRTGLILEIFGERAATAEGRLQVELAHLDYQQSRLVRSWTHLERQRGGFGFLGGPGETQIEADRRMIRQRMSRLRKELEQVRQTRALHRARRGRAPWPVIALVGYTNAGKSTLFNRLTGADVMAEDLLFATLDPTMRAISLPAVEKAILSDTVGFISDLPTQLVAAFRATLEEVTGADLIVHVRDIASDDSPSQKQQVLTVLRDLGVKLADDTDAVTSLPPSEPDAVEIPIIEVWNKADLLTANQFADLSHIANENPAVALISAYDSRGVDDLIDELGTILTAKSATHEITLSPADGQKIAWLHAHGEVLEQHDAEGDDPNGVPAVTLTVKLNPKEFGQFESL